MHQSEQNDNAEIYWYLMLHLEPQLIDKLLKAENEQRAKDGSRQPVFYLIPFLYLERATPPLGSSSDEADDNNSLRSILHNFVFIKSSKDEIDRLLYSEWNRSGRLHLHYCRASDGQPIRLTEKELTPFIALFVEHRQRFSFRPYGQDTLAQRTVHIKRGLFKDYQAEVIRIIHTADGIKLTLGIPVFNNEFTLELHECADTDVDILGGQADKLFEPYFIEGMERELFSILRRTVFRRYTDETRSQDQKRLDSYSIFNYLKFDDTVKQTHFQTLMLLCATLRRDQEAKATLIRELRSLLRHPDTPLTDEEAFVTAVLFVATRKGPLRKAAKEYCQTHEVTSQALVQLMPLIKEIRTR